MRLAISFVTAAGLFLLHPAASPAATLRFDNKADFLSAAGPVRLESFEALPATNYTDRTSLSTAAFDLTATGAHLGIFDTPDVGQHATHGQQYVSLNIGANRALLFTFAEPVHTFGLSISDWGDIAGAGEVLRFNDDAGDVFTIATAPRVNANDLFFGVINQNETFSRATLSSTGGEIYGLDEVYQVAEPSSLTLSLAVCTAGLLLCWRRRGRGVQRHSR